mgnify:CR=1 FL=1
MPQAVPRSTLSARRRTVRAAAAAVVAAWLCALATTHYLLWSAALIKLPAFMTLRSNRSDSESFDLW